MPTWAKMIPYLRIENLKNHTLSRGAYIYSPPRRGSLHALYIVAPDPAVIKPVCKYSRQILITNNIFVLVRFSSHATVYPERSRTMAYTTRETVNRLVRKQLHFNPVVTERQKEEETYTSSKRNKSSIR